MKQRILFTILVTCSAVRGQCSDEKDIPSLASRSFSSISIQAQSIVGSWTVTSIIIESDMAYPIIVPVTLNVAENRKISGNGGCNGYSGNYSFKNPTKAFKKTKKIKFSDIVSTKMFCQSASNTENAFFRSLREAATVVFKKEELVIKNRATFIRSPHGNVVIQNTMTLAREAKPKP